MFDIIKNNYDSMPWKISHITIICDSMVCNSYQITNNNVISSK